MSVKPYLDLTFAQKYVVELVDELPGYATQIHYFPGNSTRGGKDGLLIRFFPEGTTAWIGCFSFGFDDFSGIYSSPHSSHVCVIAKGKGYLVNAADPSQCSVLELHPILDVKVAKDEGLLILSTFTSLGLIGSDGILFKSQQLCWDNLRILNINNGLISGTGFDPTNSNATAEFVFDLKHRKVLKSAY